MEVWGVTLIDESIVFTWTFDANKDLITFAVNIYCNINMFYEIVLLFCEVLKAP